MTHEEKARKIAIDLGIEADFPEEHEDAVDYIATALHAEREKALEQSAKVADRLYLGFHSPFEYSENVQDAIRALKQSKVSK